MGNPSPKDVADVTFFDQNTREIVEWDSENKDWIYTGKFLPKD